MSKQKLRWRERREWIQLPGKDCDSYCIEDLNHQLCHALFLSHVQHFCGVFLSCLLLLSSMTELSELVLPSCSQYVLLVPTVVRSDSPQTACVQFHSLSEPLSLSVVLEYNNIQTTLFEEFVTKNDFFKCCEFKVLSLLRLLKRVQKLEIFQCHCLCQ